MGILDGKKGLIFGVANDRSIAAGIAHACHGHGARLGFTYLPGDKMERRVRQATEAMDPILMEPCNVCDDEQIKTVFQKAKEAMGYIDFVVHSIAFANRDFGSMPFSFSLYNALFASLRTFLSEAISDRANRKSAAPEVPLCATDSMR